MNKFFMVNIEETGDGDCKWGLAKLCATDVDTLLSLREHVTLISRRMETSFSNYFRLDEFVMTLREGSQVGLWFGNDDLEQMDDAPNDDALNELNKEGFLEISEAIYDEFGSSVEVEYERLHADQYGVYWSAYIDDTDVRIKTMYFTWDDLLKVRASFDETKTTASAQG
jgi:hypothetical protein